MNQPSKTILRAFGIASQTDVKQLAGGQNQTYQADDIIFKPAFGIEEANWIADIYKTMKQVGFRVPAPISSDKGDWVFEGWTAWERLDGQTLKGQKYQERLLACQAFHKALAGIARPDFLDNRKDAWSQADRIVWQNAEWTPHARVLPLYKELVSYQKPLHLPEQIMHGDIGGNMLYEAGQPLAVIDFSPYWRPAAYAEALLCVDCLMWERAPWSILELVELDETFVQLLLRALLRRFVEVDRHFASNQHPESYLDQVSWYEGFTHLLFSHIGL